MFHGLALQSTLAAATLLAAATAWGQGAAPGKKPPSDTPLSRCALANRQALIDLSEATEASERRHVLSPLVVSRLQGLQAQLARLREGLPRSQRTLADCEQATLAISGEKDRLQRIAGPDPEVVACVAGNQTMHGAVMQAHDALQRGGRLAGDQAAALAASGTRLNELGAAMAREGQLLPDCRQLGAQLAQERTQMERWAGATATAVEVTAAAAPPPVRTAAAATAPAVPVPVTAAAAPAPAVSPEVCRENQARSYNELAQSFATVAQAGPLAADKVVLFQSLSERLTRLRGLIADRSATGWDCAQVSQGLAQVRSELQPLVAGAAAGRPR